jgi:FkbM family methyltransferase
VSIDPNPAFVPIIQRNIDPHVRRSHIRATVRNLAISSDDGESVLMVATNPFVSRVGAAPDAPVVARIPVATRSLPSLLQDSALGSFDLVCDIEGTEATFIVRPGLSGLERCRRLIIELHSCAVDGAIYSPDDLLNILRTRWGFSLLERKGTVAALARTGAEWP